MIVVDRIYSPLREGFITINTTSNGSVTLYKQLSPFYLNNEQYFYGEYFANNFENLWQYSKVYECHVNEDGEPTEAYFEWATIGWAKKRAERYPMGKGAKPLYSYYKGQKLNYIEARKLIYVPYYAREVLKTQAFKYLKQMHQAGEKIALQDFDGYDYLALDMSLEDVLNCEKRKMGHAFVLAMLLEEKFIFNQDTWKYEYKF